MKLSFTTLGCPKWTLQQIADNAKAMEYDGVELRVHDEGHLRPDASDDEARRAADLFRAAGAPLMSLMGYCRFAFQDPKQVEQNVQLMQQLIHLAQVMKVPFIRTFAGSVAGGADVKAIIPQIARAIRPLSQLAADHGVKIGLETHDSWCDGRLAAELVNEVHHDAFGFVFDVLNVIEVQKGPWLPSYEAMKGRILYCHMKDGFHLPDGKFTPVYVGAGDLPLVEILTRFKRDGYNGYLSFEWEKRWNPEIEEPERAFPQYAYKMRQVWNAL